MNNNFRNARRAQRHLAAITGQQRQNLTLKIIALVASVLLYVYVQTERNPAMQRPFRVQILQQDKSPDVEIEADPAATFIVTGPASIVQTLSEKDFQITLNLKAATKATEKQVLMRLHLEIPRLPKQEFEALTFDPPELSVKAQVYALVTRRMQITLNYPKAPPNGFDYSLPILSQSVVDVRGRAERVNRVDNLVVNAVPQETGTPIEGEFPIVPRDKNDNLVEGIMVVPDRIHISIALKAKQPTQIVRVSAITTGQPLPPYKITHISVTPALVKLRGSKEALDRLSLVETEPIYIPDDAAQTINTVAQLMTNGTATLLDEKDRPITSVKVRIEIGKYAVTPPVPETPKPPDSGKPKESTVTPGH